RKHVCAIIMNSYLNGGVIKARASCLLRGIRLVGYSHKGRWRTIWHKDDSTDTDTVRALTGAV
ncbi:MAG: hypothetical protein QF473_04630, partial [Planctomycetota bacterium]|nr:hypothetical protein [Planctomycetota bacterium]